MHAITKPVSYLYDYSLRAQGAKTTIPYRPRRSEQDARAGVLHGPREEPLGWRLFQRSLRQRTREGRSAMRNLIMGPRV